MMFETVIGLEIHVQLNTRTKIFCSCSTNFGEKQNYNTCPVCLGLPGALPVVNIEAVKKAMKFGYAVNAQVNRESFFDRKHYFYPDSPKAYQITQFYLPIIQNGEIFIELEDGTQKRVGITQAHLEADAGKNIHEGEISKIDLNRADTPLLEIVSEPDLRNSYEVNQYIKKIHSIVRYLDISDANMQEGSFRCDVNVSIRPKGQKEFGTRVEIKNINSFKFITSAIHFEVERQREAYEDGVYKDIIYQETRLWNVDKSITESMRGKEGSADYRYFPEPDLKSLILTDDMVEQAKNIPELPDDKINRYINELKIKKNDALVLISEKELAYFFEDIIKNGATIKNSVNWLNSELVGRLKKKSLNISKSPVSAKKLAELIKNIDNNVINGKSAKDILDILMEENREIDEIINSLNLKQIDNDEDVLKIIDEVLSSNNEKVEQYKQGKNKLFGFFVGQIMKISKGSANPQKVNSLLKNRLLS